MGDGGHQLKSWLPHGMNESGNCRGTNQSLDMSLENLVDEKCSLS